MVIWKIQIIEIKGFNFGSMFSQDNSFLFLLIRINWLYLTRIGDCHDSYLILGHTLA